MKHKVIIRDATKPDYAQWRALWDDYNAFYGREGSTALSEEVVTSTWRRLCDPQERMFCLVAEYEEKLVGLAQYIFHKNTITIEDTCYLQDLFTHPRIRGMGIGRALLGSFYDRARVSGTSGVYWHTHLSNRTAMKLYDTLATNTEFVVYRSSL